MFRAGQKVRYTQGLVVRSGTVTQYIAADRIVRLDAGNGMQVYADERSVFDVNDFAGIRGRLLEHQKVIEIGLREIDAAEREANPVPETLAGRAACEPYEVAP